MRRALFIYNPIAGNRRVPKELDKIVQRFQTNDIFLDMYRIGEENEALKSLMKDSKYDMIIASGGDGTLGTISKIIINEGINKPFATLGTGTCNNFTHNIGMPEDLFESIDVISKGKTAKVDVGIVNDKYVFLSSLAGGIFVEASFGADLDLKQMIGPFAYYFKAMSEVANIKSYDIEIRTKEKVYKEKAHLVVVLNGTHLGNFSNVLSKSIVDISDGEMELILVKESNPIELANLFFSMLKNENKINSDKIIVLKGNEFDIYCDETINISIDGEKGPSLPMNVKVLEKAIEIFIP